jgi:hypothetical protein
MELPSLFRPLIGQTREVRPKGDLARDSQLIAKSKLKTSLLKKVFHINDQTIRIQAIFTRTLGLYAFFGYAERHKNSLPSVSGKSKLCPDWLRPFFYFSFPVGCRALVGVRKLPRIKP